MKQVCFKGASIVLCVTGSVAAYKACTLASELSQKGAAVYTLMTREALEFITPLQFRALTGNFVSTDMFDPEQYSATEHVRLADAADLILIAPATANVIGKIAAGIADDIVTATVMAAACPVVIAPAMNSNMYANRIVRDNIKKLAGLGHVFVGPEKGHLACGYEGLGRMSGPDQIVKAASRILEKR
jgi:phosphopantothenoylcysteine decarboxylase/phosphopantothenate--cysteine ligase